MVSLVGAGLIEPGAPYGLVEFAELPRVFHARAVPPDPAPRIWLNSMTGSALVLGSAQRDESIVDLAACVRADIDVVRRRSGGGVVLLVPGEVTWFDVIIPRGAPGWDDDVHAPMVWLGRHLCEVLGDALAPGAVVTVHEGAMVSTPNSALICFDGVGPGELLVDGQKLVGMSQRRTREAARLQCCLYHRYDARDLVALLAPHVRPEPSALRPVATIDATQGATVVRGLVERLRRAG